MYSFITSVPMNCHTPWVALGWCFTAHIAAYGWSRSQCHEFGAADVRGPSGTSPNPKGFQTLLPTEIVKHHAILPILKLAFELCFGVLERH